MPKPVLLALLNLLLLATACQRTILLPGETAERAKATGELSAYVKPLAKRSLPDLARDAALPLVLQYAFNASGAVEAAYLDWRAAIERVPQAGALPDPSVEFGTTFDANNVKQFSDLFNPLMLQVNQELPAAGKRQARAELALAGAKAAGERFRKAKFELQRDVVRAYAALALNAKMIALTSETLRLFQETNSIAGHRYHLDDQAMLADLSKIEIQIQTTQSDQRALLIERAGRIADLNGALNRKPNAPFGPLTLPAIKMTADTQEQLLDRAARNNPELAALRREIEARGAAQTLADLERRPDFNVKGKLEYPLATPTKTLMPTLGFEMTLPVNRERIRAGIAEALAMRQSAEAQYRAAESDALARLVMALTAIGDAQRIAVDYSTRIVPKAKELLDAQLASYGSGGGELLDILDTERMLIDFKKMQLQAEADRLRFVAELEEIIGEDLFRFIPAKEPSR